MLKKLTLIIFLAVTLAALLFYRPWNSEPPIPPRVADRLPNADIIGKSSILLLTKSLSSTLYFHKIPFREFLSPEFILSQGKAYGINTKEPIFFFINQNEWQYKDIGALVHISDSSSVLDGIDKLDKILGIETLTILKHKVYKIKDENVYFSYGVDWMLAYHGTSFNQVLQHVITARLGAVSNKWKTFLSNPEYGDTPIIAQLDFQELKDNRIKSGIISLSNDSSSLTLNTTITHLDTLSFSICESGPSYTQHEFTKKLVNLHFDIDRLRNNPDSPINKVINKIGAKISFPTQDFFNAWTGDVAYRQGGLQTITERYITSELDDDFNVTEVTKSRKVKISAFSLYLTMNENRDQFIDKLFNKGILTENSGNYRLLYSPPLKMNLQDSSLAFHTSKFLPAVYEDSVSEVMWTFDYTPFRFIVDSTSTKSIYGRVKIPLKKIIEKNILQDVNL